MRSNYDDSVDGTGVSSLLTGQNGPTHYIDGR